MAPASLVSSVGSSMLGINGNIGGLNDFLAHLVAIGCTHAELSTSHLLVTIEGEDNTERVNEVTAICQRHPLAYTLHAPVAINFMEDAHSDLHQAVMRSALSFGARVGASVVVIHPGRVHPHADRVARQRLLMVEHDQILLIADEAARLGIRIGMENLAPNGAIAAGSSWSYALDPRALAEQIAAIDHPAVCGTLDFGHGWVSAAHLGFDYGEALRTFAPYVGHLHITDNRGRPITYREADGLELVSYGMGDLHMPIGWGTVPYQTVLRDLPIRPNCSATVELKAHFRDELPKSIAAAHRLAGELNQFGSTFTPH